jgi:acyl-CoA thioester hydrolase
MAVSIQLGQFARGEFRHFTPSPTRWGDCDMFGHVNNVQFVRYYESGRLDYFREVLDMEAGVEPLQTLIIADIHVNFLKQINHPCALEVGSRISRLGNSSFDFEAAIFAPGEDEPYSTARAACVWFDYPANRSMPIPDHARRIIQQFEGLEP